MEHSMEQSARERALHEQLESIPELFAAGFNLSDVGKGVGVMRGAQLRGRWIAGVAGFAWYPAGAENATRKVRSEEEAVYETLRMILTSLQVMRRTPRASTHTDAHKNAMSSVPQMRVSRS